MLFLAPGGSPGVPPPPTLPELARGALPVTISGVRITTPIPLTLLPLLVALLPSLASAGLEWDRTEVSLRSSPAAGAVEAEFPYRNTGPKPVRITRVISSCGCTTARNAADVVEPGRNGTLTARFEFGDRRGHQRKQITVRTDDPERPETLLSLSVQIEEAFELDRSLLLWRRGEPATAKTIQLTALVEDPVQLRGASVIGEGFSATTATVKEGRSHTITVTPATTAAAASARIALSIQRYGAEPETAFVRVRVK